MFKKRFGQHFLSDPRILQRIVQFANVGPDDTVLEVGPGAGALTRELAANVSRVIAVEIDRDLIPQLRENLPANVAIVEGDALQLDLVELAGKRFHVVANLPYNVATPLFKRFIEMRNSIVDVTVMIQNEVAQRIIAKPGDDAYGPLSVLLQYYAVPAFGFVVPPGAFRPKPKVDSAVIRLKWRPEVADARDFTDFVHHAFGSRRKKLVNNLLHMYPRIPRSTLLSDMARAGVAENARPENLSVAAFEHLYNQICRH
jgi:16S rRNA (adenine1518-N6/adenine1519-N6)-dimethyltransferase